MTEPELKVEMEQIVAEHKQFATALGLRLAQVAVELAKLFPTLSMDELIVYDSLCKTIYTQDVTHFTEHCCRIQATVFSVNHRSGFKQLNPRAGEVKIPKPPKPAPSPLAAAAKGLNPAQLQQLSQMLAALQAKK